MASASIPVVAPDDDIIPMIWEPGDSQLPVGTAHSFKYWTGIVLFVIAYAILLPGLTTNLYSYSFYGTEITKSTLTTITLLWDDGFLVPAILLAFFALVVPAVKLLLWRLSVYYESPVLIHIVQYISKWATTDAIVVAFLMAFLSVAVEGLITTELHAGFPCFVGYCLVSTAAAMLVHASPRDREDRSLVRPEWRRGLTFSVNGLALASWAVASHISFCALAITLNGRDIDKKDVSLWSAMSILYHNHPIALPVLAVFVWGLPALELVLWMVVSLVPPLALRVLPCITAHTSIGRSCWGLASWLRQLRFWVMWDVATVSIVVMSSALNSTDKLRCEIYWGPYLLWWIALVLMYIGRSIGDDFLRMVTSTLQGAPIRSVPTMSDTTESLAIVTDPAAATPVPSDDEEPFLSGASDCAVCGQSASGMVPLSSCGHPICHRCRQRVLEPTVRCNKCDKVSTVPLLGDDESLTSSGPEGLGSPADEANSTSLWVSVAAGVSIAFAAWAIAAYMAKDTAFRCLFGSVSSTLYELLEFCLPCQRPGCDISPAVAELTTVQSWLETRHLRGIRQMTFLEEQDLRRLFRLLDASGTGGVPSTIVRSLMKTLDQGGEEGLRRGSEAALAALSTVGEAEFVEIMSHCRGRLTEVDASVIPIDIPVAAAYRQYEMDQVSTTAQALTEDLSLLSSRLRARRDFDHVWGDSNPTSMRLFCSPSLGRVSEQGVSGPESSAAAGQAEKKVLTSRRRAVSRPAREKPQEQLPDGEFCVYLGRGADGGLVWRFWPPLNHRKIARRVRYLRTSIATGEVHLLCGHASLYVYNPDTEDFVLTTFPIDEEREGRPYRWTLCARTLSALYVTSSSATNPKKTDCGIHWSLPFSADGATYSRRARDGSVVLHSPLPPTDIGCPADLAFYCREGNFTKVVESAHSVYWLLSTGMVLYLTDRHLLSRLQPGVPDHDRSMPAVDLARRLNPITEPDARALFNDPALTPRLRLLSMTRKVLTMAAGWKHALLVCEGGRIFGVGDNTHGQLGIGGQQLYAAVPTEVVALRGKATKDVACGGIFSLCLRHDGSVLSFGSGRRGELGYGKGVKLLRTPSRVPLDRVSLISCGPETACCLTATGTLFVWGAFLSLGADMQDIPMARSPGVHNNGGESALHSDMPVAEHFTPTEVLSSRTSPFSRRAVHRIAITASAVFLTFTAS
ncbi:hypothetical protein FOZ62_016689 [Perkinsus olseni]|uniref:RING-type domain-containing protein n=1 Tax=Perkinsus olseni TaxID=32597 RepID=A0A7J6TK49_PEROL|nr:hypothetical protein FOZ62_016689 [Perkinsus olseni]